MYQWDFGILWSYRWLFLNGLGVTVGFTVVIVVLGLVFGLFGAFGSLSRFKAVRLVALTFIEAFRCTPILVQLIWFFFAFPIVLGHQLTPFAAAVLGLTLNTSAYCAEIFRGGIQSIARGQWEGARALGMTYAMAMRRIVLPQVLKRMLPAFTNRGIELAKVTSLASVLAVHEVMYQGRLLSSTFYRPLEVLSVVAFIYFLLIYPGSYLSARLERRLATRD